MAYYHRNFLLLKRIKRLKSEKCANKNEIIAPVEISTETIEDEDEIPARSVVETPTTIAVVDNGQQNLGHPFYIDAASCYLDFFGVNEESFVRKYRLNRELVKHIYYTLLPHAEDRRLAEEQQKKTFAEHFKEMILQTLHYYGYGLIISEERTGFRSEAYACVIYVTDLICEHFARIWIRFPGHAYEKFKIKQQYKNRTTIDPFGTLGAARFCLFSKRSDVIEDYNGVKTDPSAITVQFVCSPTLHIMCFEIFYAGFVRLIDMWNNSQISKILRNNYIDGNHSDYIVAPREFALNTANWLKIPTAERTWENKALLKASVYSSTCVYQLKARFRCLENLERSFKADDCIQTSQKLLTVCVVLHNMCIENKISVIQDPIYINMKNSAT